MGASFPSMSPFMKVERLPAASLVSSAVFEMVSLFRSSSSTWVDFWFSLLIVAAFVGAASMIEGISVADARGG